MTSAKPLRFAAAAIAAVAIAFGAYAIGNSNSKGAGSGTANASQGTPQSQPSNGAQPPGNGQAPPGFGTPVTGATAQKVAAAALARYKGTIEHVVKLSDGTYVAHVITSNGEYHVLVSKDFKVTGVQQGGPGRPGTGGPPSAVP